MSILKSIINITGLILIGYLYLSYDMGVEEEFREFVGFCVCVITINVISLEYNLSFKS